MSRNILHVRSQIENPEFAFHVVVLIVAAVLHVTRLSLPPYQPLS